MSAPAPIQHAVFLEPSPPLHDLLLSLKARVAARFPGAVYVSHPPHMTVFLHNGGRGGPLLAALRRAAAEQPPIRIACRAWQVFEHDRLAHGGHTIAIAAEPSPELREWQTTVADAFVAAAPVLPAASPFTSGPLGRSQARYGWPFVGGHWIPHFTVASLPVDLSDPLLLGCLATPVDSLFLAGEVALYGVDGDAHHLIARVPLSGC